MDVLRWFSDHIIGEDFIEGTQVVHIDLQVVLPLIVVAHELIPKGEV